MTPATDGGTMLTALLATVFIVVVAAAFGWVVHRVGRLLGSCDRGPNRAA